MNMTSNKDDKQLDIEQDFFLQFKNPDEIENRRNSPQGQVHRACLEKLGLDIARVEYQLNKLKCHQCYEQMAFKEFLGFKLSEEDYKRKAMFQEALENWNML